MTKEREQSGKRMNKRKYNWRMESMKDGGEQERY